MLDFRDIIVCTAGIRNAASNFRCISSLVATYLPPFFPPTARATPPNTAPTSPPHARTTRTNSTTSTRRSPISTFATQLGETFNRAASPRCVNPARARTSRNAAHTAPYSAEYIDFRIAPMIEALYHASKSGARFMLDLPHDWLTCHAAKITLHLWNQLETLTARAHFGRALTHASLQLAVLTYWGRKTPAARLRQTSPCHWRYIDLRCIYLPTLNDHALYTCANLRPRAGLLLIIPPETEDLFTSALTRLRKKRPLSTYSLERWIAWRTFTAPLDAGWTPDHTRMTLWSLYNQQARTITQNTTLLLPLPKPTNLAPPTAP